MAKSSEDEKQVPPDIRFHRWKLKLAKRLEKISNHPRWDGLEDIIEELREWDYLFDSSAPGSLQDRLEEVGHRVSIRTIESWSIAQRDAIDEWCSEDVGWFDQEPGFEERVARLPERFRRAARERASKTRETEEFKEEERQNAADLAAFREARKKLSDS